MRSPTKSWLKRWRRRIGAVNWPFRIVYMWSNRWTILHGKFTYSADGLVTRHNADFLRDPKFVEAYRLGVATLAGEWGDLHIEWRAYVACWAAQQAILLEGDFVECGVNTGVLSRAVMHYIDFASVKGRKFYLVDTFDGIPEEQLTDAERAKGISNYNPAFRNRYDRAKETFAPFPDAVVVRGRVPEILAEIVSERVAYLSIDMNVALPEIAAAEYFWPRLVPGALVVLDDYGFENHAVQKQAWDEFAAAKGIQILSLPSGQGLIVKPPRL